MLRKGLAGGVESGDTFFGEAVKPTPDQIAKRFEHYELVRGEDGKPVELGRGAMGVTYKALDINLRCPVTLKVISERYLGDESARLRFLTGRTFGQLMAQTEKKQRMSIAELLEKLAKIGVKHHVTPEGSQSGVEFLSHRTSVSVGVYPQEKERLEKWRADFRK
jgi:hypothetical protein